MALILMPVVCVACGEERRPRVIRPARRDVRISDLWRDRDGTSSVLSVMRSDWEMIDNARPQKPLEDAAKQALVGREVGEVAMLDELAGVKKGDAMSSVTARFMSPAHQGETDDVLRFREGWPGMEYYSYDSAGVTFLAEGGVMQCVLVGLVYIDAVR